MIRNGFSEPLPLAEHYSGGRDAVRDAALQRDQLSRYQVEKDRKLAEFQLRVKSRLREQRAREKLTKLDRTLLLQDSEDILMKSVDPAKKPPLMNTSHHVAVNGKETRQSCSDSLANSETAQFGRYARSRLLGLPVVVPSPEEEEEEEEEEEVVEEVKDKENVPEKKLRELQLAPSDVRVHRLKESRRAYSVLEREQMRDRQREREHRETAARLRDQAEKERKVTESQVNQAIIRCRSESPAKTTTMEERIQKTVVRNKKISSQSERMINRLRSKISTLPSSNRPPALCACDADVLNTGPGLCSSNCIFNNNSKAFAQALSSLLACYQI